MQKETPEKAGIVMTEAQSRSRRRRSIALALVIGGLVVLFYLITVFRMGPAILNRAM